MARRTFRQLLAALVEEARFVGRNARYRSMFERLAKLPLGDVLDVGGGRLSDLDSVPVAQASSWTVVEQDVDLLPAALGRVGRVIADGVRLPVPDARFDTTLSIHVLEHVFEPVAMVAEMVRVTKPGGHLFLVVPQTANVHLLPHHYQNFTRAWLDEAARRFDLDVVEYEAMGGAWSSTASRLALTWLTILRLPGHHDPRARRSARFWVLAPFAALVTAVGVPVSLLLAAADVEEEANNHLVVLRRRS